MHFKDKLQKLQADLGAARVDVPMETEEQDAALQAKDVEVAMLRSDLARAESERDSARTAAQANQRAAAEQALRAQQLQKQLEADAKNFAEPKTELQKVLADHQAEVQRDPGAARDFARVRALATLADRVEEAKRKRTEA